ncbi:MAG: DUF882 domain-containing protein [Candidatus Thiodiazotropha sp. (ex Gloverina cf. vestifex)]|nr:DUF882 domain-containing protein [Candidatus Thiodiazotropha sp. (ex Gloverina cf. vestifex)]
MLDSQSFFSDQRLISRRRFLSGLASAAGLLVTSPVLAAIAPVAERTLAFRHTHTAEKQMVTYWRDGEYLADSLKSIDHLMRDHRSGECVQMDRALLDMLYALQCSVGEETGEFEIISAYRSPVTNQMLRGKSGGVAKRSLHMQGKAIDIRLCGCDLKTLRNTAISLKAGGVGYYPKSDFIHVDTGKVRYW